MRGQTEIGKEKGEEQEENMAKSSTSATNTCNANSDRLLGKFLYMCFLQHFYFVRIRCA